MCARITPEKDYHKSNSNVINLLCVDRKEREEISLQLTVSVFRTRRTGRRAGDKTHKAGSGMYQESALHSGINRSRTGLTLSSKNI